MLEVLHRNEKVKIRSTSGGGQQQQQKSLEKTKRAESSSSFAGSYSGSHFSSDDSGSIGAFYEEEDDDDLSIISFPIDDYEEQGNADSTNLKEKETEINMFENLTNYTMEVKGKSQSTSFYSILNPCLQVKPAREKYDKLINPIKQTLMAANALRNNTDLSDTDFQSEMRKGKLIEYSLYLNTHWKI